MELRCITHMVLDVIVGDVCTFVFLFPVSQPFFASHVSMKGTLCHVIRRNIFVELLDSVTAIKF